MIMSLKQTREFGVYADIHTYNARYCIRKAWRQLSKALRTFGHIFVMYSVIFKHISYTKIYGIFKWCLNVDFASGLPLLPSTNEPSSILYSAAQLYKQLRQY